MFNAEGRFFVVEGIDGSGKSTLAHSLAEKVRVQGKDVVLTREPGGTELGKVLRNLVQESKTTLDPYAELLLFAADRAQHVANVIKPALAREAIVISDRFKYSSFAYQGYGRGLDTSFIVAVNDYITQDVQPDVIFYCKIDPYLAIGRCLHRGEKQTRFEAEGISFLQKVAQGFESLFATHPRVVTINAASTQEEMLQQALHALREKGLL